MHCPNCLHYCLFLIENTVLMNGNTTVQFVPHQNDQPTYLKIRMQISSRLHMIVTYTITTPKGVGLWRAPLVIRFPGKIVQVSRQNTVITLLTKYRSICIHSAVISRRGTGNEDGKFRRGAVRLALGPKQNNRA